MKFMVTIERDEDGRFVVECPSIPGCVSQGKNEQEAVVNIKDGWIVLDQLRTVDRKRLIRKLGDIEQKTINKIKPIIKEMLG